MSSPLDVASNPYDVPALIRNVTDLAMRDATTKGRPKHRTGEELCNLFCSEWRRGHQRLASTIYNSVRWSFDLTDKEARNVQD